MKKEYINPEVKVVKLQTMTVLAGSPETLTTNSVSVSNDSSDAAGLFDSDDNEEW